LPWGLQIAAAHRPAGYTQYATFHPTFLYEIVWNLLLAGALVWLGRRRSIRAPGLFALYVAGYSFARIGEELLRVDPAHHILGLRLNLYVASILCLAGIAWFIRAQRPSATGIGGRTIGRGGALLAAGGLLALTGCGQASQMSTARSRACATAGSSTSDPGQAHRLWQQPGSSALVSRLVAGMGATSPDCLSAGSEDGYVVDDPIGLEVRRI
jgi:hypothetical protein